MGAYDNYEVTEYGLVPFGLQPCGCSITEGPGGSCKTGKRLFREMCQAYTGDVSPLMVSEQARKEERDAENAWQGHCGA